MIASSRGTLATLAIQILATVHVEPVSGGSIAVASICVDTGEFHDVGKGTSELRCEPIMAMSQPTTSMRV